MFKTTGTCGSCGAVGWCRHRRNRWRCGYKCLRPSRYVLEQRCSAFYATERAALSSESRHSSSSRGSFISTSLELKELVFIAKKRENSFAVSGRKRYAIGGHNQNLDTVSGSNTSTCTKCGVVLVISTIYIRLVPVLVATATKMYTSRGLFLL